MDIRKEMEQERIADERAYGEKMLADQRAYLKLSKEEQRDYDAKLLKIQMQMDAKSPTSMANLTASFLETYEGSKNQASNRAFYESEGVEAEMIQKFGQNNAGLIGGDVHGNFKDQIKSKNVGKVYFDVTDGKVKQVTRNSEGDIGFIEIDLESYQPDTAGTVTKEKEQTPGFSFQQQKPKDYKPFQVDPFDDTQA